MKKDFAACKSNTAIPSWRSVAHVRFGSKADIGACSRDVRFTPKSGH
jgi:hypothetical protein